MTARSTHLETFVARLCCGLSLLWMLVACNDNEGSAAANAQAVGTVGAAGGELVSRDGSLKLTVPAGALAADTPITITEVSDANVPANMQALGAARVYRLEPAGLVFAMPATATVTLPAGNTLAVLVLDSNGQGELLAESNLAIGATSRVLSARVAHFSHLAAVPVQGITLDLLMDRRSVQVGDLLRAQLYLAKDSPDGFAVGNTGSRIRGLASTQVASTPPDLLNAIPEGLARALLADVTVLCNAPSSGLIEFDLDLGHPGRAGAPLDYLDSKASRLLLGRVSASTDLVCDPAGTVVGAVRTGLFPVPFGRGPDGISLVPSAMFDLPDIGAPRLGISTALGYVLIDPLTGLVDLNLSEGSPVVQLGSQMLGALTLSTSPAGPSANAAVVGYGRDLNVLGWNPDARDFGLNLLNADAQVLDGARVGAAAILSSPGRGLYEMKQNPAGYYLPNLFATPTQLGGAPRSATLPFGDSDPRVLTVVVPADGGAARNAVITLSPGVGALGQLFVLSGTPAFAMRCLQYGLLPTMLATLSQLSGCAITQGDAVHLFTLDQSNPGAVPLVSRIDSPGALGLELGVRANGLPRAVVANYAANNLTIIDTAADGSTTSRTEPVPDGCLDVPHALPFVHGGKDYVAGTCNRSDHYFVRELIGF